MYLHYYLSNKTFFLPFRRRKWGRNRSGIRRREKDRLLNPKCLSCFPFFLEMKHFSVLSEVSHYHERPDITMTDICCWRLKSTVALSYRAQYDKQIFDRIVFLLCSGLWRQITNNLAKRHLSLNRKVNLVLRKASFVCGSRLLWHNAIEFNDFKVWLKCPNVFEAPAHCKKYLVRSDCQWFTIKKNNYGDIVLGIMGWQIAASILYNS